MQKNSVKPRIVVLGAGFGGLAAALRLDKLCPDGTEIVLVDRKTEHVYTPLLYEVATGYLDTDRAKQITELKKGVRIGFGKYMTIIGARMVAFKQAEVTGVDPKRKVVTLKDAPELSYDFLVLAFGSETEDFGIPGVHEHAYMMKTLESALKIRERLHRFVKSHMEGDKERVNVTICGAGATGVELAAELASFFERLRKTELTRHRHSKITLVEAGPTILGPFDMTVRRWTENRLRALGVEIQIGTKVKEVRANEVVLESGTIASDVTVWTGGVRASAAVKALPFEHDPKGKIAVLETFQVKGESHVFALGDCASYIHPATKQPIPALAQSAIAEAKLVAENIYALIDGLLVKPAALPKEWSSVLPLGGKYAVAKVGGIHLKGFLGYCLRKAADFQYFASILPLHYAWHVWWNGAKVYVEND